MSDLYKNKYRTKSVRLQSWNYGWAAAYFVTICTQNREHFFGEIVENRMQLSEIGKIVDLEWIKTFKMRPDMNLEMGEYIVMPNHFHAIIIIGDNEYNSQRRDAIHGGDGMHCTSTDTDNKNKFGVQSKNLAAIIRGFKSSVTTYARKHGMADFRWQTRFHEHIIRNSDSFDKITNYIQTNPLNWAEDKFYH